ncbi:hypothetical protein [Solilutibacter silvestris]|uniref:hypothetical protein n=1 Tax=Solilutibacter silvestris TaxID=1645665 RepID=UPI003D356EFD
MFDLIKSELVRFRGWAAALAGVHIIALGFMSRLVDMAQQPLIVHWVIGGVYALVGLLFGLYQLGTYRKPSQWLNLLHRPLPQQRIAAALAIAAALLLALAVALPIALIALWQDTMTARVVDLRHWLLPLSAWLIALCAWMAGAFSALRGVRHAGTALVLLAWIITSRAFGFGVLAVEGIVLAWLAMLLLGAFKPDLSAPPRSLAGTLVAALPAAMAAYLLVMLCFIAIEFAWIAQGSHPNNTTTPPPGGHNFVEKLDNRGRMLAALQDSHDPDAALLREQVKLSDPQGIDVQVPVLPRKNELANFRPMEFDDGHRNVRWVFSHDDMRLHGYDLAMRKPVGVVGVGAANAPFPAVALPGAGLRGMGEGDAVLVGGNTLYQYVSETRQVFPRVGARSGETLLGGGPVGETVAMMSDKAIYFLDGRALVENQLPVTPRLRVQMPGAMGDLRNLDLIELVDGYLITFLYSAKSHANTGAAPYLVALHVHDDGRVETVNRRALDFDYPALYRYSAWWPSPVLYAIREAARDLFAPAMPLDATAPAPMPRSILWLGIGLCLLSLVAALRVSANRVLSMPARIAWIVACGVLGLPALAALWLTVPRR